MHLLPKFPNRIGPDDALLTLQGYILLMGKKNIPHRAWHEYLAGPRPSVCQCGGKIRPRFLHHCHLADHAKNALRKRLKRRGRSADFPAFWQKHGTSLFTPSFQPEWVCPTCNEGDGWAKVAGWCKQVAVYPKSFSMTLPQLLAMRTSSTRRTTAVSIWAGCRASHLSSKWTIRKKIIQLIP
jgi:hypothetical protein